MVHMHPFLSEDCVSDVTVKSTHLKGLTPNDMVLGLFILRCFGLLLRSFILIKRPKVSNGYFNGSCNRHS